MKIAICLFACLVGYTYATMCSDTMPCDATVTTCGQGFTLSCVATSGTEKHCVCTDSQTGGHHTCTSPGDCGSGGNKHQCHSGQWECTNQHCHCSGHHGGAGGHGGNGK